LKVAVPSESPNWDARVGYRFSLIAVFLLNRAVKPFVLPVMVSMFGWTYVLILTLLTVAGSFSVGFVVGALLDSRNGSIQKGMRRHEGDGDRGLRCKRH